MKNQKKTKECHFCTNNLEPDYKDAKNLYNFVNYYMKIIGKKRTGVCSWHQRKLTVAIKRARKMALLGFTHK
ncbi:MAG: 30S ribosomal protein S18 [Patescibacteria group bacterium]|nr:30S ribosomal protein S18 [Patescibacteria group bacterium]